MEIFQTWQIQQTENLADSGTENLIRVKTGFSVTGANGEGVRLRKGETRDSLFDPTISFALPENETTTKNKLFKIDLLFWEADSRKSAEKIRALYSNEMLALLSKAYTESHKDEENAKKTLIDYIDKNEGNILKVLSTAAAALSPGAPWIKITETLLPILKKAAKTMAANATDFIGQQTFFLEIRNRTGIIEWRFFSQDLSTVIFDWNKAHGKLILPSQQLKDASGGIELEIIYQGLMLD
jgi:hypothetical protein